MVRHGVVVLALLAVAIALAQEEKFFLREIFLKYGNSGGMTYEGFEHLLENLGLGRLEFDQSHSVAVHRVNGTFKEMHDALRLHTHQHNRRDVQDAPLEINLNIPTLISDSVTESSFRDFDEGVEQLPQPLPARCLSAQELLRTFGLQPHHGVLISPPVFLHLCPAIVYELDQRTCYSSNSPELDYMALDKPPKAWLYATVSIAIISFTGLCGIALVPCVHKGYYNQVLNFLVALAVGTLCGDALLHMLPHALNSHEEGHNHLTPIFRSLVAFGALSFFFFVEAVLRIRNKQVEYVEKNEVINNDLEVSEKKMGCGDDSMLELGAMLADVSKHHGHQHSHVHCHAHGVVKNTSIRSVAWMVIAGDGLHNLTDGLAVGAAFAGSTAAGLATALAVFCHELPHELGDFAVLMKSGFTVKQAIIYNCVSSILSFIGMAIGVWIGEYGESALWVFSATAGIFLYIALADLIPEMTAYSRDFDTAKDLCVRMCGIAFGGGIMLLIALYEEKLKSLFS